MTRVVDVIPEEARAAAIKSAADALRAGGLVVLPTDTLYGVAADAFSPDAVRKLLAAKGRGPETPVPVLVGAWRTVNGLVESLPADATDLIAAFWPGALTLVLRAGEGLTWDLGDTNGTVAVRMPLHPVALELLAETGPLAVTSANRHGQAPATTAEEAYEALSDSVALYLDAGPVEVGVASSIVDLTGDAPTLLRAGAIDADTLDEVLGGRLVR